MWRDISMWREEILKAKYASHDDVSVDDDGNEWI